MTNLIEKLQWRYATKKFDTSKKISEADMAVLLESMRLAPSSFGLQPWKFIRVKTPELRVQLQANSRGQTQVTEASDLIVLAVKTTISEADVEEYVQDIIQTRMGDLDKLPENERNTDKLMEFKKMVFATVSSRTPEQIKGWNQKQAYIAMGVLLTVCADMGIDSCPMEGFDPMKYNEILGLDALGLTATLVIPVGYRAADDSYATLSKVRFAKEKLIIEK